MYLKGEDSERKISEKNKKRIKNLASKYDFDGTNFVTRDSPSWIVPQLQERDRIANECHELGHFQAKSVTLKILEKYYWPNIESDVKKVISKCEICQKTNNPRNKHLPLRNISLGDLFERIAIDLTFGLPTSKEGFVGIMVISDYLSKFRGVYQ